LIFTLDVERSIAHSQFFHQQENMPNSEVSLSSIREARKRIAGAVYFSPCSLSPSISEMSGQPVYLKLENLQRTGSFKERGALNKILTLSPTTHTATGSQRRS
jgi:threonine dehydratase